MSNGLTRGKRLTGVTSDGIRHCPLFRTVVRAVPFWARWLKNSTCQNPSLDI